MTGITGRQRISRNAVRQCHASGLSDHETSRQLGCSHRIVGLIRKELGLPAHPQKRRVIGHCVACLADAHRTATAGPVCDRCHAWAVEIEQRLAVLLDGWHDSDREDDTEPAAVTRGRGIHFKGSRDDD